MEHMDGIWTEVVYNKLFWYAISVLVTFILGIISLWMKSGSGTKKIGRKLTAIDINNLIEHKKLNDAIKKNTETTERELNRRNVYEQLETIKLEAIRWSPKKLNNILILWAEILADFFIKIETREFSKINMQIIKSEFQVKISKFKTDSCDLISEDFIDYLFEENIHQDIINKYIKDLNQYKKGKLNNLNKAFLLRSLVFFRDSLENMLRVWGEYESKRKRKNV